jgi:hypothetical protein
MRYLFIAGMAVARLVALAAARAQGQWEQSLNGVGQKLTACPVSRVESISNN